MKLFDTLKEKFLASTSEYDVDSLKDRAIAGLKNVVSKAGSSTAWATGLVGYVAMNSDTIPKTNMVCLTVALLGWLFKESLVKYLNLGYRKLETEVAIVDIVDKGKGTDDGNNK